MATPSEDKCIHIHLGDYDIWMQKERIVVQQGDDDQISFYPAFAAFVVQEYQKYFGAFEVATPVEMALGLVGEDPRPL